MFNLLVREWMPDGTVMIVSGGPSPEGRQDIARRVAAGEELAAAWADVMARERRLALIKNIGGGK